MSSPARHTAIVPGEVLVGTGAVAIFAGLPIVTVEVVNTGDRPIQVGSHYHFAEANPALHFDRVAAHGRRLAIPAGTSVRFEPGIDRGGRSRRARRAARRRRAPRRGRRRRSTIADEPVDG